MEIIPRFQELWEKNRDELLGSADKILDFLKQTQSQPLAQAADPDAAFLERAI